MPVPTPTASAAPHADGELRLERLELGSEHEPAALDDAVDGFAHDRRIPAGSQLEEWNHADPTLCMLTSCGGEVVESARARIMRGPGEAAERQPAQAAASIEMLATDDEHEPQLRHVDRGLEQPAEIEELRPAVARDGSDAPAPRRS